MISCTKAGGRSAAETDLSGNLVENYIYFNGQRIARRDANGTVHYYFSDHLGTHSLVTDANGDMPAQEESDFYPYGGEIPITTGDANHYKFTGKERDAESILDNFGVRYNTSTLGRFMTPDPSPQGISVLDPQSWNLYAYVRNRPTRFVDVGGKWATDVHAQIVTYALQEYVSAGELDELRAQQYAMDADQSNQSKHFMANRGQSSEDAANAAWTFIADELTIASHNVGPDGKLNEAGLDALGDAMHTAEDYTSPMHTDSNFMPMVWNGGYWPPSRWGPGLKHVSGEASPDADWSRIGLAIRLTMAAYLQVGAACEAGKRCLTVANFESEATRNIENYIRNYYNQLPPELGGGNHMVEEAARQCALGNPAACSH